MNEATAKPWSVTGPSDGHAGDKGDYAILDSGGFIIAECFKVVGKDEERPAGATAALIVHDHNTHNSLVKALEYIVLKAACGASAHELSQAAEAALKETEG